MARTEFLKSLGLKTAQQASFIPASPEAPVKFAVDASPAAPEPTPALPMPTVQVSPPDPPASLAPPRYCDTVVLYWDDPRPDLESDHAAWADLLARAEAIDGDKPDGLFGKLHALRCLGARLVPVEIGGVKLERGEIPDFDIAGPGRSVSKGYQSLKKEWLMPHKEILGKLLGEVNG